MDNNQNETNMEVLNRNGANYVETGTTPRHVDMSAFNTKKTSPVKIVCLIAVIIIFVVWALIVYSDFGRVKKGENPSYCLFGINTKEFKDVGTIKECIGLGYKVVEYKTIDAKLTEFVPLWEKTKSLDILEEK